MTDSLGWLLRGTITRTWNFLMLAATRPRTQIITVDDNTAPVIAAAPAAVTVVHR